MIKLQKTDWYNICQRVTNIALDIFKIPFNTRLRSEIISSLFEIETSKYYTEKGINVKNANNDSEPDLYFCDEELPLEIKVTRKKSSIKWMGNKISKKESQFILIIWDEINNNLFQNKSSIAFNVLTTYLTPNDWIGKNDGYEYHASFLNLSDIISKKDYTNLIGNHVVLEEFK